MKSEEKSVISALKEFIETYPDLKEFEGMFPKVDVDKLEEEGPAYMIELVPAEPVIKRYMDGSSVRQVVFAISSREYYEECENIDTSKFYENFADWLEESSRKGVLPRLPGGMESRSITATTPGYLYDAEGTKAQYRIQGVLKYYKPPVG